MSTIPETVSVLEDYNKWRRGDETIPQPDPFEIGVAIDDAVRLLRELAAEREKVRVLREALFDITLYANGRSDGCCPYGCDTPTIAHAALAATKEGA